MNERPENGPAIEARGLVKRYGDEVVAVDGLDLSIPVNRIYGLLGPNGAGKTTTISILTTLIEPTAGEAKVLGLDVVKQAGDVRQRVGVTFQEMVLDDELTGRQVLDYHGRLYGMGKVFRKARTEELLALVELVQAAERKAKTYSGGMKRRLELADTVGIIDRGKLVAEGAPQELIEQMGADTIHVIGDGERDEFMEKVRTLPFVETVDVGRTVIQIGVDSGSKRLVEIISYATGSAFAVEDIKVSKPSLGDVFLKYTGRRLRDTESSRTQHRMSLMS